MLRPGQKGWLQDYLEFRKELLRDLTGATRHAAHPDQSLYRIIQPTGLMYGQTVEVDLPDAKQWDEKDRMKILLAESLISASLLYHEKPVKDPGELSHAIMKSLEHVGNFYNHVFPELATPTKTLFGRKKTPLEIAEKILDKRIEHASEYSGNFWTQFFRNSLLFLDIFIFGQWIHTNADRIMSDFFKYEREELRFSVVKVIAAAAHANKSIEYEERKLFELFQQSAGLPPDRKKEALMIFEKGVSLEDINLPTNNSWILKKYFLEMAILTVWADKKMEAPEQNFLQDFSRYLDFHADDLENSQLAVEGFVLEHWEQLSSLQNKLDYNTVSQHFLKRLAHVAEQNKLKLVREVKGSEELVELLKKARSQELDEAEKNRLHELLMVVLKAIPTFVLVSLPQHFLTLPMLMQILPKNFFQEVNS